MSNERNRRPGDYSPGESKGTPKEGAFRDFAAPTIEPARFQRLARIPWGLIALVIALVVPVTVALTLAAVWLFSSSVNDSAVETRSVHDPAAAPLPGAETPKLAYLDLQPQANWQLTSDAGQGNNLAALPIGEQTFAGVKFKIGAGLIQLGSSTWREMPAKVEGIKVGMTCRKLYFLHACHRATAEGADIGYYLVNYEDKSHEKIPIVYGKDVSDWWYWAGAAGPSGARVAWEGANRKAKSEGANIRLYMVIWNNPEPRRKVATIDFGSTGSTGTSPFCVAITAEK